MQKKCISAISDWAAHTSLYDEPGCEALSAHQFYEAFDHLNDLNFARVETAIAANWEQIAPHDSSAFVLDVTDTYFQEVKRIQEKVPSEMSRAVKSLNLSAANVLDELQYIYKG